MGTSVRVARSGLFATGIATAMMGAYHLYLPTQMQWRAGLEGVPGMVQWGLFAINADFSFLLMLVGLLACVQSVASPPRSFCERLAIFIPAAFWLWHQIYLRLHPMPMIHALNVLRIVLEAFGVLVLLGAITCPTVLVARSQQAVTFSKRLVLGGGALAGSAVVGAVMAAVFWSMSTLKGEPTQQPLPSVVVPAETDADQLGIATLAELSGAKSFRVVRQAMIISDEQYEAAWPSLVDQIGKAAQTVPDPHDAAQLNLHSRQLMRSGEYEAARQAIDDAIALDAQQPLHHLQAGMVAMAAMEAEKSPMKRWSLSNRAMSAMEDALRLDPSLEAARLYVTYSLEFAPPGFGGDPDRAMALLDEAIEGGDEGFIPVRARFRLRRNENVAALEDAMRSIDAGVYHPGTFNLASTVALDAGAHDQAVRLASFAVRMDQADSSNWQALERALTALGDHTKAAKIKEILREASN